MSLISAIKPLIVRNLAAWLVMLLASGCGSSVVTHSDAAQWRNQVVAATQAQLGTPYRYGGSDSRGFDCSGLVYYAHRQAGIRVPRTAAAQRAYTRPVSRTALLPGDVVFFTTDDKTTHAGIYMGDGRFIHAPSSGKMVSYDRLDAGYWKHRYLGGGRFL